MQQQFGAAQTDLAVLFGDVEYPDRDAGLDGIDSGAGAAPLEVFVTADDLVRPLQGCSLPVDRGTLAPGHAGAHGSLLRFGDTVATEYGRRTVDTLVKPSRRRIVGGQQDMVVDGALDLLKNTGHGPICQEPSASREGRDDVRGRRR